MHVELSVGELCLVCVALAFLRDSYTDMAESCEAQDPPLVQSAADNEASARSLTALVDRLKPLIKP